jgi:hypothetical protein
MSASFRPKTGIGKLTNMKQKCYSFNPKDRYVRQTEGPRFVFESASTMRGQAILSPNITSFQTRLLTPSSKVPVSI